MKTNIRDMAARLTDCVLNVSLAPPTDPDVDTGTYIRAKVFTAIEAELRKIQADEVVTYKHPGQVPLC